MGSNPQTFGELRPLAPTRHAGLRAERLIQPARSESALNLTWGSLKTGSTLFRESSSQFKHRKGFREQSGCCLPVVPMNVQDQETPGHPGLYTTNPSSFRRANAEINVMRHESVMVMKIESTIRRYSCKKEDFCRQLI